MLFRAIVDTGRVIDIFVVDAETKALAEKIIDEEFKGTRTYFSTVEKLEFETGDYKSPSIAYVWEHY